MQDTQTLSSLGISSEDCEQGMILIDGNAPERRWQGSDAAEEIGTIIPMGTMFVNLYRSLPGVKWVGDRTYEQIRDNRYDWFGRREETYGSKYPICDDACAKYFS